MLTVVTSGPAAPGATVTFLSLALSWPVPVVAVDCDPMGGHMVAGMLPGRVRQDRGLVSWATATRGLSVVEATRELPAHAVTCEESLGAWLVPGFTAERQALSMSTESWTRLAATLERCEPVLGRDVLVDAGRVAGDRSPWPLFSAADRVLVCVRPTVRSVHFAQECVQRLRRELGDTSRVSAVVVGSGHYQPRQVAAAMEVPEAGSLPIDRRTAAALSDGEALTARVLARSSLFRAASGLGRALRARSSLPEGMVAGAQG